MSQFCINVPVSLFVGIGEGGSGRIATNTHMIQLLALRAEAGFDIPQTLSAGNFGKSHTEKLIET
jgi:hypothetical protein